MKVAETEELVALDEELEARAEALREKLSSHADPSELRDVAAALNEILQGRVLIKAILVNLMGEGSLISRRF